MHSAFLGGKVNVFECAILLRLCGNGGVSLCQVVVSTAGETRRPHAPGLECSRWDAVPVQVWSRMG